MKKICVVFNMIILVDLLLVLIKKGVLVQVCLNIVVFNLRFLVFYIVFILFFC